MQLGKNPFVAASWQELLGLPKDSSSPDLYAILGIDRKKCDRALVEAAFTKRLKKLEGHKEPALRAAAERAKEELHKARRVLGSSEARAVYDEDQKKKKGSTSKRVKALPKTRASMPVPKMATSNPDMATHADTESAPKGRGQLLVGKTIDDKYEVLAALGEGGMGTVYKARHKLLDKIVAIKVLNPEVAIRPQLRERFLREARAAMEFIHPNAVPVRDFGHTKEGLLYMSQDYSPGRSLRAIIDEKGKLEPARALSIARQCLLALGEAHRKGIVHRDVKPENILVERGTMNDDVARLCDFGIAKIVNVEATDHGLTGGAVIGTPHYMAPEQAAGDHVDARADLYAVGSVLFEALTGERLFDAETSMQVIMMQVTQAPDPPSKRRPGLAAPVDAIVLKALAKVPGQRFQTADEFAQAIERLGATGRLRPPPEESAADLEESDFDSHVSTLKFCDGCQATIPINEKAKRVGTRLLCRACYAPMKAGKVCLGCMKALGPNTPSVAAGKTKRLCSACAARGEFLRVCAGCSVLLPLVAFERKEAFPAGGKFYCRECRDGLIGNPG